MNFTESYVTVTAVCSNTRYCGPVRNTGTIMIQSRDIQVFFAVFEQKRFALGTIIWTHLFKYCTAYLNVT
jgi:hypothetical protein